MPDIKLEEQIRKIAEQTEKELTKEQVEVLERDEFDWEKFREKALANGWNFNHDEAGEIESDALDLIFDRFVQNQGKKSKVKKWEQIVQTIMDTDLNGNPYAANIKREIVKRAGWALGNLAGNDTKTITRNGYSCVRRRSERSFRSGESTRRSLRRSLIK